MKFENIEAEEQLLGSLIYKNSAIMDLEIRPEDFSLPFHSFIFTEMERIFSEKQSFVVADFEHTDYMRALADAVVIASTANIKSHAGQIKELKRKRDVMAAVEYAQANIANYTSSEIIAQINTMLIESVDCSSLKTGDEIYMEILTELDLPPLFCPTGLHGLDVAMAGGLYAGFTYGLAGAEKAGKTTFAHTISSNLSESGHRHLYIALEMGAKQIEQRNIARKLKTNSLNFITKRDQMRNDISNATPSKNTIYLDAPGADLNEILSKIGIARMKYQIKGFILDYWQLVEGKDNRETDEKHLRNVAQTIANYARKHGLWCIMLAQMNKDGQLFGGNGLRKACDQLYFIETPEGSEHQRWLRMDASRYTPKADIGSEECGAFSLESKIGPYIESF